MATTAVNWAQLERVEFETLEDIWRWSGLGAGLARNSGLIVLSAAADVHSYMKDISGDPRSANGKARKVTNHLNKVANSLAAAQAEFQKIPPTILKVYEAEIAAARRKNRPRIDLSK